MGKSQRDKGYRGEHEVVQICEKAGVVAIRNFMSGMYDGSVDVWINNKDEIREAVSVKRRANGMQCAYDELEKVDYILFRSDRGKWLKIEKWGLDE